MGKKVSPTLIGAFVVGAVALALLAVVIFGSGKLFEKTSSYVLMFTESVNGLEVGAPVKFKGVPIGTVTNILLALVSVSQEEREEEAVDIPVIIELDETKIIGLGGRDDIADPENVEKWIRRGLRAQLQPQSLITGLLFVELTVRPDAPAEFRLPLRLQGKYIEIPTIPTTLEKLRTMLKEFLGSVKKIKIEPLVKNLDTTMTNINDILQSEDLKSFIRSLTPTMKNLNQTLTSYRQLANEVSEAIEPLTSTAQGTGKQAQNVLAQTAKTLKRVDALLEPDSPLMYELVVALKEVTAAARAIEALSNELERNPSLLIRGRVEPKDDR